VSASFVIPAQAGIHLSGVGAAGRWIPAFSGMTGEVELGEGCFIASLVIPAQAGIHYPALARLKGGYRPSPV
jgi:hypothetical protein